MATAPAPAQPVSLGRSCDNDGTDSWLFLERVQQTLNGKPNHAFSVYECVRCRDWINVHHWH